MYKRILLAYDGSSLSDKALDEGVEFATQTGSKVTLLYVLTPHHLLIEGGVPVPGLRRLEHQYSQTLREHAEEMLLGARNRLDAAGVECDALLEVGNHPYEHIVRAAERLQSDLIVMASHGRRGIEGLVVGSQTVKVLTHSTIPVLVVR